MRNEVYLRNEVCNNNVTHLRLIAELYSWDGNPNMPRMVCAVASASLARVRLVRSTAACSCIDDSSMAPATDFGTLCARGHAHARTHTDTDTDTQTQTQSNTSITCHICGSIIPAAVRSEPNEYVSAGYPCIVTASGAACYRRGSLSGACLARRCSLNL